MDAGLRIERVDHRQVIIVASGCEGFIRFWAPECVNAAYPGFQPEGVRMLQCPARLRGADRVDVIPALLADHGLSACRDPVIYTRGPETMILTEAADETTTCERLSSTEAVVSVSKPKVFQYESRITASEEALVVSARLANRSSWDWRDAYVSFCCGVDSSPALSDHTGERTFLFTARGPVPANRFRKRVWAGFRPTAQYY